ncbi:MAG: hypothetical protein K0R89_1060 [Ramlibacter sp.]|jgi:hypothetical protein|nr:hypothetical protein [Ramlibacter sp.]
MHPRLVLAPLLLASAGAFAQAPIEREPAGDPRRNQKVEHIRTEDSANRIDEVRVGGQTQSVTVQPKAGAPAYQMQPDDLARSRPSESREGFSGRKQRVWNLFDF